MPQPPLFDPKPTDGADPSKRKGSGFEPEVVEVAAGLRHRGVKNPAVGIGGKLHRDIGAVLTRQEISTNLQSGPSKRGRSGPTRRDR
jgi:hypothetical protein